MRDERCSEDDEGYTVVGYWTKHLNLSFFSSLDLTW